MNYCWSDFTSNLSLVIQTLLCVLSMLQVFCNVSLVFILASGSCNLFTLQVDERVIFSCLVHALKWFFFFIWPVIRFIIVLFLSAGTTWFIICFQFLWPYLKMVSKKRSSVSVVEEGPKKRRKDNKGEESTESRKKLKKNKGSFCNLFVQYQLVVCSGDTLISKFLIVY